MPAVRISDDGTSVTFLLEDGSTHVVDKATADSVAPGPVTSPGFSAGGPPLPAAPGPPDAVTGAGAPPVAPVSGGFVAPRLPPPARPVAPALSAPPPAPVALPQAPPEPDVTIPAPPIAPAAQPRAPKQQPIAAANPFQEASDLGATAFDRQRGAIGDKATAEQVAADDRVLAQQEADARVAEIEAARAKQAEADLKERATLEREHADAVKAYGNFKIDENQAWKEMGGARQFGVFLGAALAALGAGIAGRFEQNPVLGQLYTKLEQNVRAQMAQREALGETAQLKATAADRFGRLASDRGAEFHLRMAGEAERLKRRMQVISDKTSSDTVKANYELAIADIDQRQAGELAAAGDKEWDRRYKTRQLAEQAASRADSRALGWAQLGETQRNNDLDFEARQNSAAVEVAKLRAAGQTKEAEALAARSKEERETSVGGRTGAPLLNKEGQALEKQAEAVSKQSEAAAATGNAVQAELLKGKASELRQQAMGHVFKARDAKVGGELAAKLTSVEEVGAAIDEMIKTIDRAGYEPDALKSEDWQRQKALFSNAVLRQKDYFGLGVLSEQDEKILHAAIGTDDPTQWRNTIAGMKTARSLLESGMRTELKHNRYTGEWTLPSVTDTKGGPKTAPDKSLQTLSTPGDAESTRQLKEGKLVFLRPPDASQYANLMREAKSDRERAEYEDALAKGDTPVSDYMLAQVNSIARDAAAGDQKALGHLETLSTDKRSRLAAIAKGYLPQAAKSYIDTVRNTKVGSEAQPLIDYASRYLPQGAANAP